MSTAVRLVLDGTRSCICGEEGVWLLGADTLAWNELRPSSELPTHYRFRAEGSIATTECRGCCGASSTPGAEPLYLTARIEDGRVESEVARDRP